uniref:Uncharacterized protein n=1 Tax=Cynoglossus semilaevis TaxID=244447 RepID=A0A3P8W3C1_CYNSE
MLGLRHGEILQLLGSVDEVFISMRTLKRMRRMKDEDDLRIYVFTLHEPSYTVINRAVASITAYWFMSRPRPMLPPCDLGAQSVAVNVSEPCRQSALQKDDLLLDLYYDDTRTVYDMFQRSLWISRVYCVGQSSSPWFTFSFIPKHVIVK